MNNSTFLFEKIIKAEKDRYEKEDLEFRLGKEFEEFFLELDQENLEEVLLRNNIDPENTQNISQQLQDYYFNKECEKLALELQEITLNKLRSYHNEKTN